MQLSNSNSNLPGYVYQPKHTYLSNQPRNPTYSLGARREKQTKGGLFNETSTPINVGPDSYQPTVKTLSTLKKFPEINFQKSKRFVDTRQLHKIYETFYVYSSLGGQISSVKKTGNQFSMGKNQRMVTNLNSETNRMTKINLPHAKY